MTQKQKKERMAQIVERMKAVYPEAVCALEWNGEPWKLLIMGRLSAQCTDARVNLVCRELFDAFPTPEAMARAEVAEIEDIVRPCGLYHVKAQNTKDACVMLVEEYGGVIPDTMEELLRFPGVGRKVANLLLGDLFHKGGMVTDTHCIRICGRLGMYPESLKDPVKIEKLLDPLVAPEERCDFCHRIVQFGRDVCTARAPRCDGCPLSDLCAHFENMKEKTELEEMNMKKLCMGMMRLPLTDAKDPKSVDMEQVCRMIDTFLERGFTYVDTAYMYHSFQSEIVVREALVKRHPRESFLLASKLPTMFLKEEGDQERIFAEQLEKCGVEYFDYYLVHSLDEDHYKTAQKFDSFGFVANLKKQGKVRNFGFSFHDTAEVLDQILTDHPEVDFVQIQLNYLDWEDENIQSRRCHEVCLKHNKPVIVMEPVKGGTLASVSGRVKDLLSAAHADWSVPSWAIRFAASCENVFMVLSGMSNMEQLLDNMSYMENFVPLTEEDRALLPQAVKMIFEDIAVACTACRYCVDGCPKKIEIPKYFALYNQAKNADEETLQSLRREYASLTESYGKASDCIRCRQCVRVCPQHIRIIAALGEVARVLE